MKHYKCKNGHTDTYYTEKKGERTYIKCCQCQLIIKVIQDVGDYTTMFFGSYKGKKLKEIPDQYLRFIYENNRVPKRLLPYIENRLKQQSLNEHLAR